MQKFNLAEFKASLERRLKQVQADIAIEHNSDALRKGELYGIERCLKSTLYSLIGYKE